MTDPDLALLEDDDNDIILLPEPVLDAAGFKRPAGAAEAAAEADCLRTPANRQKCRMDTHDSS